MANAAGIFAVALLCMVLPAAAANTPSSGQTSTVDSYTPAQEANARSAATGQGFEPGPALFAQDGNFFFNATKDGRTYALTVTPDGQVYSSTAVK